MKRRLAALLAATMLLTTGTTVFGGEENWKDPGDTRVAIKAKYDASQIDTNDKETVSVDLVWGSMDFTFQAEGKKIWNPKTHTYDFPTQGKWKAEGNTVTATNHSNIPVLVKFWFEPADAEMGVTGSFTAQGEGDNYDLETGFYRLNEGTDSLPEAADSVTVELTLKGSLTSTWNPSNVLGSMCIQLNKES